ncbi:hypothetical protein NEMIN01_0961 [Nematocida minor]|uniref:uncharacterized protein n=1 Tax=Nematocida minor TaxID=1912983 RepID=UPI002220E278|nr:uncharacterized protein NEMIN01_0961 [Nematocida minor]KAI5190262.1 hypothetical protein NEMIN01_0961 [Nematocida minor]
MWNSSNEKKNEKSDYDSEKDSTGVPKDKLNASAHRSPSTKPIDVDETNKAAKEGKNSEINDSLLDMNNNKTESDESEESKNKKNSSEESEKQEKGESAQQKKNIVQQKEEETKRSIERSMYSRDPNFGNTGASGPNQSASGSFRKLLLPRTPRKFKSPISLQTLGMLVTIAFFGTSLYLMLKGRGDDEEKSKSDEYYEKNFNTLAQRYGRITPNDCKQGAYYGLDKVFDGYMQLIFPYLIGEKDGMNRAVEMQKEVLKKNMIIYGLPGTGKSFFACKIFLQAALNIKGQQLLTKLKTTRLFFDEGEGIQNMIKDLYDCNDTVEMYNINPSMFLTKLVGDSEKSLKLFLNFIDWRQKHIPVFIFMDEAEALLGARRSSKGGGDDVSNNLKNTWLTWLDGIDTKNHKRVFAMAATNYYDRIDGAIRRRFASYLGIPVLTPKERGEMLKKTLYETNIIESLTPKQKKELVEYTRGFSSNRMMRVVFEMENIKKSTKKQVPFRALKKGLRKFRLIIDDEEEEKKKKKEQAEKHKIVDDDKMSDPKTLETNIIWNKINTSVVVSKAQMMKIEQKLGAFVMENNKEKEIVNKMFGDGIDSSYDSGISSDEESKKEGAGKTQDSDQHSDYFSDKKAEAPEGWLSYFKNAAGGAMSGLMSRFV